MKIEEAEMKDLLARGYEIVLTKVKLDRELTLINTEIARRDNLPKEVECPKKDQKQKS